MYTCEYALFFDKWISRQGVLNKHTNKQTNTMRWFSKRKQNWSVEFEISQLHLDCVIIIINNYGLVVTEWHDIKLFDWIMYGTHIHARKKNWKHFYGEHFTARYGFVFKQNLGFIWVTWYHCTITCQCTFPNFPFSY